MRLLDLCVLSSMMLVFGPVSADPRERGAGDTDRHPDRTERPEPRHSAVPDRGRTRAERVDPAVRQFWSDRCVNQRRFGTPHTGDCDNPAYSGGGYGRGYGYPPYPPYGTYEQRPYRPRGGAVIIEREDRRSGRRPAASMPSSGVGHHSR